MKPIFVALLSMACAHVAPSRPAESMPGSGGPAGATALDWYLAISEAQPIDDQNLKIRTLRVSGASSFSGTVSSSVGSGTRSWNPTVEGSRLGVGPDTYFSESGTDLIATSTTGLFVATSAEFGFQGTTDGMSYTSGSNTTNIRAGGNVRMTVSSTAITASAGVKVAMPQNSGTCTLNGGSPATCTVTVTASAVCVCAPVGTSAAIAATDCAVNLSGTTLTVTAANAANNVVNVICDR